MKLNLSQSALGLLLPCLAIWSIGCGGGGKSETPEDLFTGAQQLLQDEKYEDAMRVYRKIATEFPQTKTGANSQFMVGYIYANHMKNYDQARAELNHFLQDYAAVADSGLIAGAQFELEFLGKDIEEIPVLSELGTSSPEDTATAPK